MLGRVLSLAGGALGHGRLSILIYHQVLDAFDPMRPDEPVESQFHMQMRLIARYFTPLSLSDALVRMEQGELPRNAICVTFDDGYKNNLTVAQPILERYGVPATVFIATAFADGSNMWNDRLTYLFGKQDLAQLRINGEWVQLGGWDTRRALTQQWIKRLKYLPLEERSEIIDEMYRDNGVAEQPPLMMSREEIKTLHKTGVGIGAHTMNHPILSRLPESLQQEEIVRSREALERWTQSPVAHFAYPNGKYGVDYDNVALEIVKKEGFAAAVSTDWGTSTVKTSRWQLRRFTPWDRTPLRFHSRLLLNAIAESSA